MPLLYSPFNEETSMKSRAQIVVLSGLLCLILPRSLRADLTYTYKGNPYGAHAILVTFETTLTNAQLDNLAPGTNISADLASFSISDGDTPPPADKGGFPVGEFLFLPPPIVEIGTGAVGNITSWDISEAFFASYPAMPGENPNNFYCDYTISTVSGSAGSEDQTALTTDHNAGLCPAGGKVQGDPGVWFPNIPEPQSGMLLGGGLLGLLALAVRRKRHPLPAGCRSGSNSSR